eukprot:m.75964 g.75964  ORF g.75964 m.75964 type:complete len:80 (+) comp18996_c0_seq3:1847-2086(+)
MEVTVCHVDVGEGDQDSEPDHYWHCQHRDAVWREIRLPSLLFGHGESSTDLLATDTERDCVINSNYFNLVLLLAHSLTP